MALQEGRHDNKHVQYDGTQAVRGVCDQVADGTNRKQSLQRGDGEPVGRQDTFQMCPARMAPLLCTSLLPVSRLYFYRVVLFLRVKDYVYIVQTSPFPPVLQCAFPSCALP